MRKLIITATALVAFAVPAVASADAPDGDYPGTFKANGGAQSENASLVGELSSRSIQNGQFISGTAGWVDQATEPGSRAALIQGYLGRTE